MRFRLRCWIGRSRPARATSSVSRALAKPALSLRARQLSTRLSTRWDRELGYVRRDNGTLRIGALTRHYQIAASSDVRGALPLLSDVAGEVGDEQVRSMGTIGGVLAHADPAGDYGTLALMLDATIVTNKRSIPA